MALSQRILVTGATGTIGYHVVRALAREGHQVLLLTHRSDPSPDLLAFCVQTYTGDICCLETAKSITREIDVVVNLAAHIPRDHDNPCASAKCIEINALGAETLARASIENGVGRFIHVSTAQMYAHSREPCGECSRVYPDHAATYYLGSKLLGELLLRKLTHRESMVLLVLRLGTVYGPGEHPSNVVPTFLRHALTGQPIVLQHGGKATYSFVYVLDVADCVARAIECGGAGIYNVAGLEHLSIEQLAQTIKGLMPERNISITIEKESMGQDVYGFPPVSSCKAQRTWLYEPRSLLDGLQDYLRFLNEDSDQQFPVKPGHLLKCQGPDEHY